MCAVIVAAAGGIACVSLFRKCVRILLNKEGTVRSFARFLD